MVEKWLQQVERVMLASMREVISLGIEAYVQVNKNWCPGKQEPGCTYQGIGPATQTLEGISGSVLITPLSFTKTHPDPAGVSRSLCASLVFCKS